MKKLLSSLVVGLMLVAGLLVGSSGTATAACPYGGCAVTSVGASVPTSAPAGRPIKISISFGAPGAAVRIPDFPKGSIRVHIRGVKPTKYKARTITRVTGNTVNLVIAALPKGKYEIGIRFKKFKNTKWSSTTTQWFPLKVG